MERSRSIARERRPHSQHNDAKPTKKDKLVQIIAYLGSLHSQMEEEVGKGEPPSDGQRFPRKKRLPRTGVTSTDRLFRPYAGDGSGEVDAGPHDPLGNVIQREPLIQQCKGTPERAPHEANSFGSSQIESAAPSNTRPKDAAPSANPVRRRQPVGWSSLAAMMFVLSFSAAAYLLVQSFQLWAGADHPASTPLQASAPRPEVEAGAADESLKIAGLALDAIAQEDFTKAIGLLAKAQRDKMVLPGMCYQAALIAARQENLDAANIWIDRSIAANESVPECLYLRAYLQTTVADYQGAAESFEEAARQTSFTPRNYFFQAESLRRKGRPASAIPVFEQALLRRPSGGDKELIVFKMRLAKLETGIDLELQGELAYQLSQQPTSGNTLLLAAANAIEERAYAQAAEYLRKAAQVLPPVTLKNLARDFIYTSQARQPSIASLLASAGAVGDAPLLGNKALIDPASLSLEEADPAKW